MYLYGVDIGGTSIKLGLFIPDGKLLDRFEIPTNTDLQGQSILSDIAAAISENLCAHKLKSKEIFAVGLGVPGTVHGGIVTGRCINLNGWGGFDAAGELRRLLGIPVVVLNDANAAALGEQWAGSARPYQTIAFFTLGTGVGGALLRDSKIVEGKNGAAGEFGHIRVSVNEQRLCGCGGRGCLEQYASARGLARFVNELLSEGRFSTRITAERTSTAKDIFDLAKAGDPLAEAAVERYADYLGRGIAAVGCVWDPEVFLIGGGISAAGEYLLARLRSAYQTYAFPTMRDTPILAAVLGNDAGIYGAARFALGDRAV